MAYRQPSGTSAYDPFASDIVLDAYGRCGVFDLTAKHMASARRSSNLLLTSSWSNKGANLWKIEQVIVPLTQGVNAYNLTRDIATVYDCFRRQYSMNVATNFAVAFSTVLDSTDVTVSIPGSSAPVGSYLGVNVPVSVGGIVLSGFYLVTAQPTANSVLITAEDAATATVTDGGAVPVFTTTAANPSVSVALDDHGLLPGQPFNVAIQTVVGGITLFGSYTVGLVTSADIFTITASQSALSSQTVAENGGLAFLATTNLVAPYSDNAITPISRSDWSMQSNKTAAGPPTTIWVDKQIIPIATLWPVPDANGPYELHMYVMRQVQDVVLNGGATLDLPPRMLYAFTLDLARDLSMTYAPDRYQGLKTEAMEAWAAASSTDVESGSTFILPILPDGL